MLIATIGVAVWLTRYLQRDIAHAPAPWLCDVREPALASPASPRRHPAPRALPTRAAAARIERARSAAMRRRKRGKPLLPTSTARSPFATRAARASRAIAYPPELPVAAARRGHRAAIREHQVVIVCGETGSGKTTQIPKICLEIGRGERGLIGHTQPRRIAARASRRESRRSSDAAGRSGRLQGPLHRSHATRRLHQADDRRHPARRDAGRPRRSPRYDTIIIDEAHERSLNIDFLLGYLKQLLVRRRI